jgi:hypothetical protein
MRKWEKTFPDDLWKEFAHYRWAGFVSALRRNKYLHKARIPLGHAYEVANQAS